MNADLDGLCGHFGRLTGESASLGLITPAPEALMAMFEAPAYLGVEASDGVLDLHRDAEGSDDAQYLLASAVSWQIEEPADSPISSSTASVTKIG